MNRKWLLLFPMGMALFAGYHAQQERAMAERIQANATPEPEAVTLRLLLARPASSNPHVTVSSFRFGPSYAAHQSGSTWQMVWVPIFAPDGQAALVKTRYVSSEKEMSRFSQQTEITGVVTSHIEGLGPNEYRILQDAYPNLPIHTLRVIEDRAVYADPRRIPFANLALATVGIVLLLCVAVWWAFTRTPIQQPPTPTPAEAAEAGATMGKPLALFRERDAGRTYLAGALLLLLLGVGACPFAITSNSPDQRASSYGIYGANLVFLLIGIRYASVRLRSRLWVFEDGFVLISGGRTEAVKWSEVRAVADRFSYQTETGWKAVGSRTVLRCFGNRDVTLLKEADNLLELGILVQELVYANLYPRMRARLAQGHEISFGDVALSSAGIRLDELGEDVYPWSQITSVSLEDHGTSGCLHLIVRRPGVLLPWVAVVAVNQDNVGLFERLANEYLRASQNKGSQSPQPDAKYFPPKADH